jgi:hypothetical protein
MASIKARYPNQELTPETAEAYLEDWALMVRRNGVERFKAGLREAVFHNKFFPGPAEIAEHIPAVQVEENETLREMRRLEKARKDNPDQFFGLGDLARDVAERLKKASAEKQMEAVKK